MEKTGRTPDQVDELPLWFSSRLPGFWAIQAEVRAEKQREAQKG